MPDISVDADDGIALESEGIDLSGPDLELSDGEMAVVALPATNDGQSLVRITKPANGATVNTGTKKVTFKILPPAVALRKLGGTKPFTAAWSSVKRVKVK